MRRYELMLLFRPDLEDDKLQSAVEKVTRAIVNAGGALTKVSPWGKRRLAYEIQHFREASYFLLHFDIAPAEIREIERGLLISEEILRHLVTVLEDRGAAPEEEIPAAVPATGREAGSEDAADDGEQPIGRTDRPAVAGEEPEDIGPDAEPEAEASGADESGADESGADEPQAGEPVEATR